MAVDPDLVARIEEVDTDDAAEFLTSFQGGFNVIAKSTSSVWMPLLSERPLTQMERVYELVKPDEVAAVLPSPARDPRRADHILLGYQEFLFDQLKIDPRNVVYASEQNSFKVHRQVRKAALHYHDVLQIIGGCKSALPALSNKLMLLWALPVTHELRLGVAHADSPGVQHGISQHAPRAGWVVARGRVLCVLSWARSKNASWGAQDGPAFICSACPEGSPHQRA